MKRNVGRVPSDFVSKSARLHALRDTNSLQTRDNLHHGFDSWFIDLFRKLDAYPREKTRFGLEFLSNRLVSESMKLAALLSDLEKPESIGNARNVVKPSVTRVWIDVLVLRSAIEALLGPKHASNSRYSAPMSGTAVLLPEADCIEEHSGLVGQIRFTSENGTPIHHYSCFVPPEIREIAMHHWFLV